MYDRPFSTLLDGGAILSLVWENTLVAIVNHATAQGKTVDDPGWPLAYLAHWDRDSSASSVAGESDLRVCGLVDLRVELRTTSGERVMHVFRFRILRGGFTKPPFLLVGAPALDAPPLGIGHRPQLNGHYFPGLGITVIHRICATVIPRVCVPVIPRVGVAA